MSKNKESMSNEIDPFPGNLLYVSIRESRRAEPGQFSDYYSITLQFEGGGCSITLNTKMNGVQCAYQLAEAARIIMQANKNGKF